jgi:alanyl-tRNA synthetase
MGLERIVSIIQDVPTNFDTDLIRPIIAKTEDLAERKLDESRETEVAMKVIADHSRAAAFLINDGILPSNEGRGYVLRRIMRRAIRYGRNIGLKRPFLYQTSEVVFDIMKPAYPELAEAAAFITNVIKNEEIRFLETLDTGMKLLNDTLADIQAGGRRQVPGNIIFKLYDTYGFPVDIVQDVVRDINMSLDMDGFDRAMEQQRARSRTVATFDRISDAYKKLSSAGIQSEFVGYDALQGESRILLLVSDGEEIAEAEAGRKVEIVTEITPFYAEAGGQIGDTGTISGTGFEVEVSETIKDPTGLIIHKGKVSAGKVSNGQTVTLQVNGTRRKATELNHTATHILHAVLRQVLGEHVKQAGSLVTPERLRFDFSHFSQVETDDLDKIESLVNERIRQNMPTSTQEMDAEDAFQSGATALFEEKYGDRVRVVSLVDFSRELCGGTHTARTGNIGLFKIVSESSVASGVRRIEALTGAAALDYSQQTERILQETAHLIKEKTTSVPQRVKKMLAEVKAGEKEIDQLKTKLASVAGGASPETVKSINGVKVMAKRVAVDTPAALRNLADQFKDKIGSGIVVLGSKAGSKAMLIAVVTKDLTDRYHAGNIVKEIAAEVGGRGGGRPDMAQAGGNQPENLEQALAKAYEVVAGMSNDE